MSNTSIASRLRGVFTKAGLAAFVILLAALAPPGAGAEVVTNAVAPAGQAFIRWTGGNVPLVKTYRNPLVLPDGASLDGVEAVFGPAIYVATNGVAEADGSSWENATTLVNAFAIAVDGDVIVISNGTYNAGATLAADRKAITIRGLTGNRDDVILSSEHARRVLNVGGYGKRSVVADLTIAKGGGNDGAGIYAYNGVISNCRVTECVRDSQFRGLAIYATNWSQVLGCLLDNNQTTTPISGIFGSYRYGKVRGTLYMDGNSSCDGVIITNNFVEGAYAEEGGVGIWMNSGSARNCIIADNFMRVCDARDGAYAGAVHVGGGVFENNAVYRNVVRGTQSEQIAAVRVTDSGKVRNSLIADNGLHGTNNWSGPVAAFSNCCTTAAGELDDCIPAVEGAYALADGLPRLPNASPLAARSIGPVLPDGTAEFVCPFTITKAHALDALETTLTARPVGDTAGLVCTWTLEGDGTLTPAPDGLTAAFSLTTPGTAQVTLTAENAAGGSFTSTQTLGVSPSKLYVVKDNADAAAPYATWTTAATNIATAVAAAEDGAEVIVSNGTYVLSAYVPILKDVHVRGVSANRNDVFIDCQNKCQAFVLASQGAMVSNMRLYRFAKGAWYVANSAGITLFGCGTVTNCHFDGANTTYTSAKALRNRCGIVRDCTFERCVGYDSYADPDWTGNGVLIQYGKIALTERCIFTNNAVNPAGGTAWGQLYVHDGIVRNCHIADNSITATATFSGPSLATGVRIRGGLIENCTIVRNRAIGPIQPFVAGLVQVGGTVRNCLMVDNASASAVDEPVDWLASTPASLINCAAASVDGTESGVAVTASAYVWKDGVLRLTPLSPAINAGVTADWMAGATDLLGKPRVMGSSVDIGAIEFDPNALAVDFSCDTYEAIDEYNATLTAIINGDTTGLAVVWDLDGDGIYETSGVSVEFRLDKPGQTTVSVKATNNGGEEATCSHIFTVYPHTLYVVSQNPAAAAPYTNWTTAAATIGDAIALAGNGSAIIVSNGTYAINSQILLTRAINLRGLTGDFDDVIVDAQNNCRALKVATAGASVSGITFKRGMEGSVSGAYVYGGSVSNCRFTAHHVRNLGGVSDYWQIATLACDKGTVIDCVVDSSDFHEMYRTQRSFGHLYLLGGAFAERCVVTNNTNTGHDNTGGSLGKSGSTGVFISNGTLRNSLVARNRMLKPNSQDPNIIGGGAYLNAGRIENCTIVTNTIVENTNLTYYAYYALYNHQGAVVNTIVADHWALENAANPGTAYPCGYATGVFTNSCLPGAAELPGAKNIESVGATTYAFDSDARLLFPFPLSPCQNRGLNEPWMTDAVDLHGNRRIFGPRVDIGCLECQRSAGTVITVR